MDVYWSIERCGWVPCRGPVGDALATAWSVTAAPEPVPDMPLQRVEEPAAVEH